MTAEPAAGLACNFGLPCSNEAKCGDIAGCLWTTSALFYHTETARSGFSAFRYADQFYIFFPQTVAAARIVWLKVTAAYGTSITFRFWRQRVCLLLGQ